MNPGWTGCAWTSGTDQDDLKHEIQGVSGILTASIVRIETPHANTSGTGQADAESGSGNDGIGEKAGAIYGSDS